MNLIINQKFKTLLPPLSAEEFNQLEENIRQNGCETALMIWRNQIIDGHNRYEICQRHDIPFATIDRSFDFETEDDVLEWILTNQIGRRNLHPNLRTIYFANLYALRGKRVGAPEGSRNAAKINAVTVTALISDEENNAVKNNWATNTQLNLDEEIDTAKINGATVAPLISDEESATILDFPPKEEVFENSELSYEYDEDYKPKRTSEVLAKELGVSPRTINNAVKVKKVLDTLPPETQEAFIQGKLTKKEVLERAPLTPEQTEMVRKKEAINNEAKWNEFLRRIENLLMDIHQQGGIQTVTALWSENGKKRVLDRISKLQSELGTVAEQLTGENNEG